MITNYNQYLNEAASNTERAKLELQNEFSNYLDYVDGGYKNKVFLIDSDFGAMISCDKQHVYVFKMYKRKDKWIYGVATEYINQPINKFVTDYIDNMRKRKTNRERHHLKKATHKYNL